MNRSGDSVASALAELPVAEPSEDLIVAFDDVDLPFGRLRLRPGGGAGGHRGLAHVIERLGRRDFPRLRFGVGRPPEGTDTVDWVLTPFSDEEERELGAHLERAARALESALREGVSATMNLFNRDPHE
jgi:PTH1 family peptidyl-tRNA hydrolase